MSTEPARTTTNVRPPLERRDLATKRDLDVAVDRLHRKIDRLGERLDRRLDAGGRPVGSAAAVMDGLSPDFHAMRDAIKRTMIWSICASQAMVVAAFCIMLAIFR